MKRFHLFEFEDLTWFPDFLRNFLTDFLQDVANRFDIYKCIVPVLKRGIEAGHSNQVIDLASGGGGGWLKLSKHLQKEIPDLNIHLTDFYPNLDAFQRTINKGDAVFSYEPGSVNALEVPEHLKGMRTLFASFHHFKPEDARNILQDAVDSQAPIAVVDFVERSVFHFFFILLTLPLVVLFNTPFIRPFKFSRIIFTYLIPLVPLFVVVDGLLSVLRSYTPAEMENMARSLENGEKYQWITGQTREKWKSRINYLIGLPGTSKDGNNHGV